MKPPAVARALVRFCSDPSDRAFLLQDLSDRFRELARTKGPQVARRWYWTQALSTLRWALVPDTLIRRRSWAGLVGDLRLGLRTLTRRPLYALGVAGTLGIGLAAAMITFAVAWGIWLAPMPYPEPDGVVRLYEIEPPDPTAGASRVVTEARRHLFSEGLLADFRTHQWRTIDAVAEAGWDSRPWELTLDGTPFSVSHGVFLSPEGLGILGIVPMLGRLPVVTETELVLSERFWRANFGADPDIIGSRLFAGPEYSMLIVGVARLPSGYPYDVDIVGVIDRRPGDRDLRFLPVIARVRPEHSVADAQAEVNVFMAALAQTHPEHRGWSVEATVLADDLIRPFRGVIVLLLAAGTTFLLLAGVNVLGLVAARRVEGRHDRSIRRALGASEPRLLRGSLIESVLLSAVGTVAGVLGAYWLIAPIRAMVPQNVPRLGEVAVTSPLVIAALSIGLALGAVIGLAGYMVSRSAKASMGRAPMWRAVGVGGRRALVVGQVALTALLTAGGAAILHRVFTLRAIDLGFEAEGVSTTTGDLSEVPDAEREDVLRTILDRFDVRGIPAALGFNTPMNGATGADDIPLFGISADAASEEVFYELHPVTAGYFSVMGIDVLAGRAFRPTDDGSSEKVVIVSEDFVDQYFSRMPLQQVVGRTLEPVMLVRGPTTVVGIVRSTRHHGPDTPATPSVYVPYAQQGTVPVASLLVGGEPARLAEAVSEVLGQLTPEVRWSPLVPYTSYIREWFTPLRFQIVMIGALAGLGLLLAALGLYSLMAYQVATRSQELGIRKALGAADGKIVTGVVTSGMTMALLGGTIGLGAWYQLLPGPAGSWTGSTPPALSCRSPWPWSLAAPVCWRRSSRPSGRRRSTLW